MSIGPVVATTVANDFDGSVAPHGDSNAAYEGASDKPTAPSAAMAAIAATATVPHNTTSNAPQVVPVAASTAPVRPAVPTVANIEQHTRALEATGGPPPAVQHIGRFIKKTMTEAMYSENGSYVDRDKDRLRTTDETLGITCSYTTASNGHEDGHADDFLLLPGAATSVPGAVADAAASSVLPTAPAVAASHPTVAVPAVGVGPAPGNLEGSLQSTPPARGKVAKGRFHITKSVNGDRETTTAVLDMEGFDSQLVSRVASSHDLSLASPPQPPLALEDAPTQAMVATSSTAADTVPRQSAPAAGATVTLASGTTSSMGGGVPPASAGISASSASLIANPGSTTAAAAKRQSRFMVLEERGDWPARHASENTQATNVTGATVPTCTNSGWSTTPVAGGERRTAPGAAASAGGATDSMPIINRKLNELIDASTAQQEAMRTLVSAISEASRGKDALLIDLSKNPLVGIHLLGSEQSSDALVMQNTRLKHEVDELKRKNKQHQEKVRASAL